MILESACMGGGTVRLVWVEARLGLYGRRHGWACMGRGTLGLYGRRHGYACMGGGTVRLVWAESR